MRPPWARRHPASASAMRCAPPRGKGQPTAWAAAANTSPKEALRGASSGRVEWAAMPAKRARARWPRNLDSAIARAECTACSPNRAMARGWRGRPSGASRSWRRPFHDAAIGPSRRCHAAPSSPRWRAAPAKDRSSRAAVPSSKRMGERRRGVNPLQTVRGQVEGIEAGRGGGHGVDRGADVVVKAGKREFAGAGPAADGIRCFEDSGLATGTSQHDRGGQTIGSGADDGSARSRGDRQPPLF